MAEEAKAARTRRRRRLARRTARSRGVETPRRRRRPAPARAQVDASQRVCVDIIALTPIDATLLAARRGPYAPVDVRGLSGSTRPPRRRPCRRRSGASCSGNLFTPTRWKNSGSTARAYPDAECGLLRREGPEASRQAAGRPPDRVLFLIQGWRAPEWEDSANMSGGEWNLRQILRDGRDSPMIDDWPGRTLCLVLWVTRSRTRARSSRRAHRRQERK